jgi:hypothetical protein
MILKGYLKTGSFRFKQWLNRWNRKQLKYSADLIHQGKYITLESQLYDLSGTEGWPDN